MTAPKCEHQICRSPRHPIADLPCGRKAAYVGPDGEALCLSHVKVRLKSRFRAGVEGAWDQEWALRIKGGK